MIKFVIWKRLGYLEVTLVVGAISTVFILVVLKVPTVGIGSVVVVVTIFGVVLLVGIIKLGLIVALLIFLKIGVLNVVEGFVAFEVVVVLGVHLKATNMSLIILN